MYRGADMPETSIDCEVIEIQTLFKKGKALRKDSQYEEAIMIYDKILEIDSKNIDALYGKVHCNFALAHWKEIEHCVDAVYQLEPNNAYYLLNKARTLLDSKNLDGALEYFDKVAAIWPNDSDIWNSKGILLLELGKVDEAMECFKQAISLLPDIDNFNSDYLDDKHHQKALECLEKLIHMASTPERLSKDAEAVKKHIEYRRGMFFQGV